ncbi:hypothetical protein CNMCM5793_004410 [Aspergillus hiratsukae]|uniref:SUN domain protein n=1 Tax=Aspergillus hiratsukae TaxID=1194566 RepID=A0A8H6QLA3_9EURO|nr:hypothetical protein CNMCM5793_004410 [Aspergillus hiratsukae]KAF7173902.1 hypothetical protein CNMCM6106_008006 [Aspergillus hiratsukae]
MRFDIVSGASALLWFIAGVEASNHAHLHRVRHQHGAVHSVAEVGAPLEKRGGKCEFPTDAGLVPVTPNMQNAGWAMSPDQPCLPGNYCPYACPPGQVMMQWDPEATSYSYPMSMNGGLYCDEDGNIKKPFPDKPYCADGTGAFGAKNKCSKEVAICQTVLPGNEAMLIPTLVQDMATLAVPDLSYWCETAAHYYINPPGYDTETACVWGTSASPIGNWSPYVAGANTDGDGNTFVKIGWNPIYLEPTTPFRDVVPDFGVEIECEGNGCNGLPCRIDPEVNAVNEMIGSSSVGAGGATFCVVTVPKGEKANVVVFDKSGSAPSTTAPASTSQPSTSTSTTSSSSTSTSTSTPASSSEASSSDASSSATVTPSASGSSAKSSSAGKASESGEFSYTYKPHVFVEQSASVEAMAAETAGPAQTTATATPTSKETEGSAADVAVSVLTLGMGAVAAIMINL